eukprot:GHVT01033670.1.p1 GENE.GHVT01033670.1~~GHVT01033670.1.p1  ORF type:complete len:679 (+),score=57.70 GHVT01033670.1:581-2617(+)
MKDADLQTLVFNTVNMFLEAGTNEGFIPNSTNIPRHMILFTLHHPNKNKMVDIDTFLAQFSNKWPPISKIKRFSSFLITGQVLKDDFYNSFIWNDQMKDDQRVYMIWPTTQRQPSAYLWLATDMGPWSEWKASKKDSEPEKGLSNQELKAFSIKRYKGFAGDNLESFSKKKIYQGQIFKKYPDNTFAVAPNFDYEDLLARMQSRSPVTPALPRNDLAASTASSDAVPSTAAVTGHGAIVQVTKGVSPDSGNTTVQLPSFPAKNLHSDHTSPKIVEVKPLAGSDKASSNDRKRYRPSENKKIDFDLRTLSTLGTLSTPAPYPKVRKEPVKPPAFPRSIMEQIIDAFVFDVMGIERKFNFNDPLVVFKCNWPKEWKFPEHPKENDPVYKKTENDSVDKKTENDSVDKKTENDSVYKKTFREIFDKYHGLISVDIGGEIKALSQLGKLSNEKLANEKLSFDTPVVVCCARSISFNGENELVWFYRVVGRFGELNLGELPKQTVGTVVSKWETGECITPEKPISLLEQYAALNKRRLSDGTQNGLDVVDNSNWGALHGNAEKFLCPQYNPITNEMVGAPNIVHVAEESYSTSSVASGSTVAQNLLICASLATAAVVIGVLARKAWQKIQRNAVRRRRLPSLPIPPTPQPANTQGGTHQNKSVDLDRESRNPDPTFVNGSHKK